MPIIMCTHEIRRNSVYNIFIVYFFLSCGTYCPNSKYIYTRVSVLILFPLYRLSNHFNCVCESEYIVFENIR